MSNTPETPLNSPNTDTTPAKKSGGMGFKLALALLVILGGTGAAGYLAYERGMANPYLPEVLQKKGIEPVSIAPVNPTPTTESNSNTAPSATPSTTPTPADGSSTASATVPAASTPTPAEAAPSTAPAASPNGSTPANPATAAATTAPTAPAAVTAAANQPILSNAVTSALLTTLDAQNQWQTLQYDFQQNWDTAHALQQVQILKNQLQAANNSALLPSISALTQVEGQLQAWNSLNPKANLSALQQTLSDMTQLHIRTLEDQQKAQEQAVPNGWWNRFIATLKQMFEVQRINTNEVQALNTATAAIVKQGINANLTTALWSARSGQWSVAQEQVRQANSTVQQFGQGYTLDALKPLLDNANAWPSTPDFSVVQQALTQARSQLTAQMQSEAARTTPAPANTAPAPTQTPNPAGSSTTPAKGVSL